MLVNMDARYYRLYYLIQGMLSKDLEYLKTLKQTADGGVRSQSTLPPELNKRAHNMTNEALSTIHTKRYVAGKLQGINVSASSFHSPDGKVGLSESTLLEFGLHLELKVLL